MADSENMLLGGPAAASEKPEEDAAVGAPPGERETWQWLSRLSEDWAKARNDSSPDRTWGEGFQK